MADRIRDQTIQLYDGRKLGFARYGSPHGKPVFYFTGGNSSRIEGEWFASAAERASIDLIVPDRPGFGLSDFQPERRLLDWPEDISQLADRLALERFSIFGLSGGGPHVLAAAYKLPARISRAAVVSGVAPPEMPERLSGMWPPVRLIYWSARNLPALNRILLNTMSGFYSDPEEMKKRMGQSMPPPDTALFEDRPEVIEIFAHAAQESHRSGLDGDALEWRLYVSHWGFRMTDIRIEVGLWYGLYDRQVPVGMGRYLDGELRHSQLTEVEDGGHFSTINNHIDEIFSYLVDESPMHVNDWNKQNNEKPEVEMAEKTVDGYIASLEDWQAEIISKVRGIILDTAPEAKESIKWAQPVYESGGPFAYMKAFKKSVNFGFWRGIELDDSKGVLVGSGEKMRHVKLGSLEDVDEATFSDLVKQAVALNEVKGDPTKG